MVTAMIHHLVFLKLRPECSDRGAGLVQRLNELNGKVPGLIFLQAGLDVIHSEASWDIGLRSEFANLEDLEAYRVHPEHQSVVSLIKEICAARAVVDYQV